MKYRPISPQDAADVKAPLVALLVITSFLMILDLFLHRLWPLESLIPGLDPAYQYNLIPAILTIAMCALLSKNGTLDMSATTGRAPSSGREIALFLLAGLSVFLCSLSTQIAWKGMAAFAAQADSIRDSHAGILRLSFTADRFRDSSLGFWLVHIIKIIPTPVYEELLFRGLILRKLLQKFRPSAAIVLSAAIFGLVHINGSPLYATLAGLILGYLYYSTGSLWVVIVAHAVANTLSMIVGSILGIFVTPDPVAYGWNYTLSLGVCLAVLAALLTANIAQRVRAPSNKPVAESSATGLALPTGNTTDANLRQHDR